MVCPGCGKENKNTNIRCESCNQQLIDESKYKEPSIVYLNTDKTNQSRTTEKSLKTTKLIIILIAIFMSGPSLVAGLVIGGIGTYGVINQNIKATNYEKTSGKLVDKNNCSIDEESKNTTCNGVYQYEVAGKTYTVKSDVATDKLNIEQIVYYNPSNPEESLIKEPSWFIFIGVGLFILVFPAIEITIAVIIYKSIKRRYEQQQGVKPLTI